MRLWKAGRRSDGSVAVRLGRWLLITSSQSEAQDGVESSM